NRSANFSRLLRLAQVGDEDAKQARAGFDSRGERQPDCKEVGGCHVDLGIQLPPRHRGPARAEGKVKHSLRALHVGAALLAGCGITLSESDWRGPASSNWAKDSYECERDARLAVGSGGRETFREVRSLAEQCMVARGYSKLPAPR